MKAKLVILISIMMAGLIFAEDLYEVKILVRDMDNNVVNIETITCSFPYKETIRKHEKASCDMYVYKLPADNYEFEIKILDTIENWIKVNCEIKKDTTIELKMVKFDLSGNIVAPKDMDISNLPVGIGSSFEKDDLKIETLIETKTDKDGVFKFSTYAIPSGYKLGIYRRAFVSDDNAIIPASPISHNSKIIWLSKFHKNLYELIKISEKYNNFIFKDAVYYNYGNATIKIKLKDEIKEPDLCFDTAYEGFVIDFNEKEDEYIKINQYKLILEFSGKGELEMELPSGYWILSFGEFNKNDKKEYWLPKLVKLNSGERKEIVFDRDIMQKKNGKLKIDFTKIYELCESFIDIEEAGFIIYAILSGGPLDWPDLNTSDEDSYMFTKYPPNVYPLTGITEFYPFNLDPPAERKSDKDPFIIDLWPGNYNISFSLAFTLKNAGSRSVEENMKLFEKMDRDKFEKLERQINEKMKLITITIKENETFLLEVKNE